MAIPANEPRPPNYTGKHGERYFYRGRRWLGDSNRVGAGGGRTRNSNRDAAHVDVFGGSPNAPRYEGVRELSR